MNKISQLCPTRARVEGAKKLLDSVMNTADNPERVEVLFYADNDDPQLDGYQKLVDGFDDRVLLEIGEPMSPSKSWNIIAKRCSGDMLAMANDDLFYQAKGWDTKLDEKSLEYPDGIFCFYFNDNMWDGERCCFPIVSRLWYDTLGYFTPGFFQGLWNDAWIQEMAKGVGRLIYIPDWTNQSTSVHEHWTTLPNRPQDETTKRRRQAGMANNDRTAFNNHADKMNAEIEKLKKLLR